MFDVIFAVGVTVLGIGIVLAAVLIRDAVRTEQNISAKDWRSVLEEYNKSE